MQRDLERSARYYSYSYSYSYIYGRIALLNIFRCPDDAAAAAAAAAVGAVDPSGSSGTVRDACPPVPIHDSDGGVRS